MTAVVTSPEDIVNIALGRIGRKERIGSMLEGSEASKLALDCYGQTRDDLLRAGNWDFARRDLTITATKTAPAGGYNASTPWTTSYPPPPFKYQFAYPGDCLEVRAVKRTPVFLPDFDPQPHLFSEVNDTTTTPVKVIVTYIGPTLICTYTGQVTDPTNWEATFVEQMIDAMAERLAPGLQPQALQGVAAANQVAAAVAEKTQG